jgi:arylsulfatase A-like enzyme
MKGLMAFNYQVGIIAAALHLLLAAGLLGGCSPDYGTEQGRNNYNVVLISIDTLRADHLGCYGYGSSTSLHVDALASQSTRYSRSLASSPWTLPTHASLFTGKYPFEHGARTFKSADKKSNVAPLPLEHLTLAEIFKQEGYQTGAFVANAGYMNTYFQLNQGFDTYYVKNEPAKKINQHVSKWLGEHANRPFFLFINYMDTHRIYNTEPRSLNERVKRLGLSLFGSRSPLDDHSLLDKLIDAVMPQKDAVPRELVNQVIMQYDRSIENVDEQIGTLLDHLKKIGLYESSLIVLTSDHGEYFGEHDLVEHSKDIYEEALHVPLIIKERFQKEGRVEQGFISSVDIPAMIFSQLPGELFSRYEDQFPYQPGNHPVVSQNYYTRHKDLKNPLWGHRFKRVRTAIYEGPYKYINSSDGRHELYNLDNDPREVWNLLQQEPKISVALAQKLKQFTQNERPISSQKIDAQPLGQQAIESLKSLGYLE